MMTAVGRRGRRIVAVSGGGGSPPTPRFLALLSFLVCLGPLLAAACVQSGTAPPPARVDAAPAGREELFDSVERRTFDYFWEVTNPRNGLVPDRAPSPSFSSIAAVGFGLTAYPIGVERGW